jgi:hypothetical protein
MFCLSAKKKEVLQVPIGTTGEKTKVPRRVLSVAKVVDPK